MKTCIHSSPATSIVAVAIATIVLSYSPPSHSCGLEPTVNGGFTISYPGSIDVAVAVSRARNDGFLPAASPVAIPNEVRLQQMLADLRRLQSRLNKARKAIPGDNATPFSLVLVGPGLWSHFYLTSGGVLANYHTDGPLAGKVVVLTHHSALRALLEGSLSAEAAVDLGLIAFSGSDAVPIREAFEIAVRSSG